MGNILEKNRKFKLYLLFSIVSILMRVMNLLSENGFITIATIILGGYALSNVAQKGVANES